MSFVSKRDMLALWSEWLGFTRYIESLAKGNCLIVLNYHRIGDHHNTLFDPGVFSATQDDFYRQVLYLKHHFHLASFEEALNFIDGKSSVSRGALILITFDDGYLDNYELAFPVLKGLAVQATFFLPTEYIGTIRIPWWDLMAYLLKHTHKKKLRLGYPIPTEIDLSQGIEYALRSILKLYKAPSTTDPNFYLSQLTEECDVSIDSIKNERLFMNWDEARALLDSGMAIGSHTHSHSLLSKLSFEQQVHELRTSRDILQERLGVKIEALAYPVGGRYTFSKETYSALNETGYRAAFSYYGGVNLPGKIMPFDVLRVGIEKNITHRQFRLQLSVASIIDIWY